MPTRHLELPGMYNARDLGGLLRHDGSQTVYGKFVRSDSPHAISSDTVAQLIDYGVRTVIDLRYDAERALLPNPFATHPDVQYHATPLFHNGTISANTDLLRMEVFYRHLLDTAQPEIAQVLTQMAASEGAVLYHCRVGKDRTGIISALLLMLADVTPEAIIADFVQTERHIQPMLPDLRAHRPSSFTPEQYEQLLDAKHHYIEAVLEHVNDHYHGAHEYLEHIGVAHTHIHTIQQRLI